MSFLKRAIFLGGLGAVSAAFADSFNEAKLRAEELQGYEECEQKALEHVFQKASKAYPQASRQDLQKHYKIDLKTWNTDLSTFVFTFDFELKSEKNRWTVETQYLEGSCTLAPVKVSARTL